MTQTIKRRQCKTLFSVPELGQEMHERHVKWRCAQLAPTFHFVCKKRTAESTNLIVAETIKNVKCCYPILSVLSSYENNGLHKELQAKKVFAQKTQKIYQKQRDHQSIN